MPPSIALITDSTCDLPAAWIDQYHIRVIPLTIIFGTTAYLDGVDLQPVAFYERLLSDPVHPTTSQPAPGVYLEAYRAAKAEGAEQALVISLSGGMSGAIESARRAAAEAPLPVTILDSRSNSMGLGWQVITAARARESGAGLEGMLAAANAARAHMAYYIALDTIEYLSRGGRIAEAVKFLDSLLQIKPIVYVRHESGTVGAGMPARSRKNAVETIYKEFFKHVDSSRPLHLTVLHNNAFAEAEALAERVRAEFHPAELFVSIVSPVLGVHTGPRAIALCGYAE